jgi:cyclase
MLNAPTRSVRLTDRNVKRGLIIAKIKPGKEAEVAQIFADSDQTELPTLAGVRHRSLFVLEDIYVHYVETDADFELAVDEVRDNPLFREISKRLDEYITPYNPETWRSPKDATAREFYTWNPGD